MPYSVKNLTTKSCSLLKQIEILLLRYIFAKLIEDMYKIDGIYLYRTNAERGTANRVDESFKFRRIRKESATVTKRCYISTYEEVGIVPLAVMVRAPSCKLLIYKLAILIKKAIS
jgi:hypothetical protein